MLFHFNPTADKNQNDIIHSLYQWTFKNRMVLVILLMGIILATLLSIKVAIVSSLLLYVATAVRSIWRDITSLDFTVELDEFSLQDVINDLESR